MIQKLTVCNTCVTSPIIKLKTFHLYTKLKEGRLFIFTKNSIKVSIKKENRLLGKKIFSFFSKSVFFFKKKDNSFVKFFKNSALPLKKKKKIAGSFIIGPVLSDSNYLKIKNKFLKLIVCFILLI